MREQSVIAHGQRKSIGYSGRDGLIFPEAPGPIENEAVIEENEAEPAG